MGTPLVKTWGDAIVAALNAADLSESFTAKRLWYPFWKSIESVENLQVLVVPNVFEEVDPEEAGDRDHGDERQQFYIGVQKKLQEVDSAGQVVNSEIDDLAYLTEEIRNMFFRHRLSEFDASIATDAMVVTAPYVIVGDHIREARVFTAAVTLELDRSY